MTTPKSFPGLLWHSFLDIRGPILWLITFGLAILFRLFPLNASITLDWAIPSFLFLVLVIVTFGKAAYQLFEAASKGLPRIIVVKKEKSAMKKQPFFAFLNHPNYFRTE